MNLPGSTRVWAAAAAGVVALTPLALPAVASATPPGDAGFALSPGWIPAQPPPPPVPPGWYHPEWGPGWNNGYPARGWIPPANWGPPEGWTNPTGWEPPPGWAYPRWWCSGPWRQMWHLRCA